MNEITTTLKIEDRDFQVSPPYEIFFGTEYNESYAAIVPGDSLQLTLSGDEQLFCKRCPEGLLVYNDRVGDGAVAVAFMGLDPNNLTNILAKTIVLLQKKGDTYQQIGLKKVL